MKKPKRDWTEIAKKTADATLRLGHSLGEFAHRDQNPFMKWTGCTRCDHTCWIAFTPTRGFFAGGPALKHPCVGQTVVQRAHT